MVSALYKLPSREKPLALLHFAARRKMAGPSEQAPATPSITVGVPGWSSYFSTVEDYTSFMEDPLRVTRLEWRRVRYTKHGNWTSHSMLDAHLLDFSRLRFEFFVDSGLVESMFTSCESAASAEGEVYRNMTAAAHELSRPMRADELREVVTSVMIRPDTERRSSGHQFVQDLWNAAVMNPLKTRRCPDRVKSGLIREVSRIGPGIFAPAMRSFGTSLASLDPRCVDKKLVPTESSGESEGSGSEDETPRPSPRDVPGRPPVPSPRPGEEHVRISVRREEGSRISGEFTSCSQSSAGYDRIARLKSFALLLDGGAILTLDPRERPFLTTVPPPSARAPTDQEGYEVWASQWLADAGEGEAGESMAERLVAADLSYLAARLPGRSLASTEADEQGGIHELPVGHPMRTAAVIRAMASSMSGSGDPLIDLCFVVLRSPAGELRFASYAILAPASKAGLRQQLRMLSGDVLAGRMRSATYCLRDLPEDGPTTADGLAREELDELRAASVTGDWGFLTLA